MYGALRRCLPGPVWVRIVLAPAILAGAIFVLFTWAFPRVDGILNPIDVTVEQ